MDNNKNKTANSEYELNQSNVQIFKLVTQEFDKLKLSKDKTSRVSSKKKIPKERSHKKSASNDTTSYRDRVIRINVGGTIFETFLSTLLKYPSTLLGSMFHPKNTPPLVDENSKEDVFFDRSPRLFEIILDFYRTSQLLIPPDIPHEALQEELKFFKIDVNLYTPWKIESNERNGQFDYKNLILPAREYRKMTKYKLLKDHHDEFVRIIELIQQKIERKAKSGHNSCSITFYSPLHYTNYTPKEIFNVISMNEMREFIVELLKSKDFIVEDENEYSKKKTTNIIGLHDQVTNYDDPKYFTFHIKW